MSHTNDKCISKIVNYAKSTHQPEAPARDANSHNNVKHQLGEEDKKECKEVEGTVTPVEKQKEDE